MSAKMDRRWQHIYQLRNGRKVWAETQGGWIPYPRGTLLVVEGARFIVGPPCVDPLRREIRIRVWEAPDVEPLKTSAADLRKAIAARPGVVLAILTELFGSPYAVASVLDQGASE